MLTIAIWSFSLLTFLFLNGLAMGWAARLAGSARGRFRIGIRAAIVLLLINIATGVLVGMMPTPEQISPIALLGVGIVVQLVILIVILGHMFDLSGVRILAPVAAYLVIGGLWFVANVFGVRPHLTEAFVMPTQSMSPTIKSGDRFFVNRLLAPRRWDLVAYWSDSGPDHQPMLFCKRLIALPGERLRFENGQIYINDAVQDAPAVVAGKYHASIGEGRGYFRYRDGETIQLGDAEYFFIGDNVEISADSRMEGPTERSKLVGCVDVVYWPLSSFRVIR